MAQTTGPNPSLLEASAELFLEPSLKFCDGLTAMPADRTTRRLELLRIPIEIKAQDLAGPAVALARRQAAAPTSAPRSQGTTFLDVAVQQAGLDIGQEPLSVQQLRARSPCRIGPTSHTPIMARGCGAFSSDLPNCELRA